MQSNYYPYDSYVAPQLSNATTVDESLISGDEPEGIAPDKRSGRRKIKIEYIDDKSRRHITFSKRKAGIMKKAYELSTLTGTQVLLLVVSETGLVYTFTTPKLQPIVAKPEGKNLIQSCLNASDPPTQSSESNNDLHQILTKKTKKNKPKDSSSINQNPALILPRSDLQSMNTVYPSTMIYPAYTNHNQNYWD